VKEPEVLAVNVSDKKGTKKKTVEKCVVLKEHGIEGDAHAGKWHRQVSLLAVESIDKMQAKLTNITLEYGDFAENITTRGIDLKNLPIGTRLKVGDDVLLEVTQIGKECHLACDIRKQVGDCIMPREGIFAKVLEEGEIKAGNKIQIS
jgi:MOSC domain-containing protein YiiM